MMRSARRKGSPARVERGSDARRDAKAAGARVRRAPPVAERRRVDRRDTDHDDDEIGVGVWLERAEEPVAEPRDGRLGREQRAAE